GQPSAESDLRKLDARITESAIVHGWSVVSNSCQLSVASCQLSVVSCRESACGPMLYRSRKCTTTGAIEFTGFNSLPTTNYQLPTTNHSPLPTTHYPLTRNSSCPSSKMTPSGLKS